MKGNIQFHLVIIIPVKFAAHVPLGKHPPTNVFLQIHVRSKLVLKWAVEGLDVSSYYLTKGMLPRIFSLFEKPAASNTGISRCARYIVSSHRLKGAPAVHLKSFFFEAVAAWKFANVLYDWIWYAG